MNDEVKARIRGRARIILGVFLNPPLTRMDAAPALVCEEVGLLLLRKDIFPAIHCLVPGDVGYAVIFESPHGQQYAAWISLRNEASGDPIMVCTATRFPLIIEDTILYDYSGLLQYEVQEDVCQEVEQPSQLMPNLLPSQ